MDPEIFCYDFITEQNYLEKIKINDGDIFAFMRTSLFNWNPLADKVFKAYREIHGNHKYLVFLSEVRINEISEIEPSEATPEKLEKVKNYSNYDRPEIMFEIDILMSSVVDKLLTLLSKMHTYAKLRHIFLIHDEQHVYAYTFDPQIEFIKVNGNQIRCHQIRNGMRLPAVHLRHNRVDVVYRNY